MAKKIIKSSKPAQKATKVAKPAVKKAVKKEVKKTPPVKKKIEVKAKPVSKGKTVVAKKAKPVVAAKAKAPEKKNVKKAMPAKTTKAPAKKAVVKKAVVAKPVATKKAVSKPTPTKKAVAKTVVSKKVVAKAPVKKEVKPVSKAPAKKEAKPASKSSEVSKAKNPEVKPAKEVAVAKKGASVAKVTQEVAPVKPIQRIVPDAKKASPKKVEAEKVKLTPEEILLAERPKPRMVEYVREAKPTANPVFVVTPEGMANVKFAPLAKVEKNEKKESQENMKTTNRFAFVEGDNKNSGITIENKLRALYDVQLIDSRIDKIHATRGELPLEVEDLENEVAGLQVRVGKMQDEANAVEEDIAAKKQGIKDAEAQIKKYKEQLDKVKNNREYEALNKEIEFQELEIQLFKKKIREAEMLHETKLNNLEGSQQKLENRTNDLDFKKKQLSEIIAETEREEAVLLGKSAEAKKLLDQRLLDSYERIRKGANNGLAVVPIDREASAGSFIHIPPQKQMDVAARKKVIVDEHSGRILVDSILANEQLEKINAMLIKELGK
jgi:predicted  nucleic acid-binding Zn-ribbon protein